jgi:hypothetical protein
MAKGRLGSFGVGCAISTQVPVPRIFSVRVRHYLKLQLVQWLGDSDVIEEWKECAKCKKIVFSDRCEKCKAFSLWDVS